MSSPTTPSYVFPDNHSPSPTLLVHTPITLPVLAPLPPSELQSSHPQPPHFPSLHPSLTDGSSRGQQTIPHLHSRSSPSHSPTSDGTPVTGSGLSKPEPEPAVKASAGLGQAQAQAAAVGNNLGDRAYGVTLPMCIRQPREPSRPTLYSGRIRVLGVSNVSTFIFTTPSEKASLISSSVDPEPPWKMRHLITKSGRGIQSFIDIPNVSRLRVQGGIVDACVVNPVFFTTCNANLHLEPNPERRHAEEQLVGQQREKEKDSQASRKFEQDLSLLQHISDIGISPEKHHVCSTTGNDFCQFIYELQPNDVAVMPRRLGPGEPGSGSSEG
ncbi:hypothetical protein JOM56_005731 [Amanita muscaria]